MVLPEYITRGNYWLGKPDPDLVRIHHPNPVPTIEAYPGLVPEIVELGGDQLTAAYAYGAPFNGESSDSLLDLMLVVRDPAAFHHRNGFWRPEDYPHPVLGGEKFQKWLNRFSPNFYRSSLTLDDGKDYNIKYGVLPYYGFVYRWADVFNGDLYVAGRLQKAALVPLVTSPGTEEQAQFDRGINKSRIGGMWLAQGTLPERFSMDELALAYVNLSYMADRRIEKVDKARIILEQSPQDYEAMFDGLVGAFVDADIIEEIDEGQFQKKVSLKEDEVNALLKRAASMSWRYNFLKNPLTFGPLRGLEYSLAKVRRAKAANKERTLQEAVV